MCQHRSQLAFVVADAQQRGVQHHVAAEEGEGVDLVVAHQIEMERRAHRIGAGHQPVAQLVDVLAQQRIVDQRGTGAQLAHVEIAHRQLLSDAQGAAGGGAHIRQLILAFRLCWRQGGGVQRAEQQHR